MSKRDFLNPGSGKVLGEDDEVIDVAAAIQEVADVINEDNTLNVKQTETVLAVLAKINAAINNSMVDVKQTATVLATLVEVAGMIGPDSSVNINIQDQTSGIIDLKMHKSESNPTLAIDAVIDINSVTLTAGHSVAANDCLCFKEGTRFSQFIVLSITDNVAVLDSPLDYAFTTNSEIIAGVVNANLKGSITTQIFSVCPPSGVKWDITRMFFFLTDNVIMDSAKFGGIAALTNGIVVRICNGTYYNIMNVKTNADFAKRAYDIEYDPKAPAGVYGFRCRRSFAGQEKNGVAIRLDGDSNDEFQVLIQDDLTDLVDFQIVVQGHIVED